ncbi:hypothetical protein J6590_003362 [Homalodisca vitripennis]|nr:hypothetical protein J6590_003362 [Homalodisca vitripennis]
MSVPYSIGILTVSDRCFRGETEDESGPYLRRAIEESRKLNSPIFVLKCVPDEVSEIEGTLKEWADVRKLDAVFTTGGTGFAPRDVTPEATRNVIEKEAPAIPSAILYQSLAKTKMAMLSRAVCGVRKKCLIINFPGSKKAVGECLDVVIDCVPHALALLRDNTVSVSATHQALQASVTSKVDVSRVARRARESVFPMVDVEESLHIVRKIVSYSISSVSPSERIEEVSIHQALGRVIDRPVTATCSLPPYRASVKDGYAAISTDGKGPREVISVMVAGSQSGQVHCCDGAEISLEDLYPLTVLLAMSRACRRQNRGYVQPHALTTPVFCLSVDLLVTYLSILKTEGLTSSVGLFAACLEVAETKALCQLKSPADLAIDPIDIYLGRYQNPAVGFKLL